MTQLKFGVVGVGEMGKFHAQTLRYRTPGAGLVAVADANPARAESVARELGIDSFYESLEAMLDGSEIDAVVISSPPKFHDSAIRAAAAACKQIFCEKPLATMLENADSALEAVARAGVKLQIGHMRRYDPAYREAKHRIDAGEIGRVVLFKSIGRDHQSSPQAAAQTELNGTLFHDSSTHDFDLARWLVSDEVTEVHAYTGSLAIPDMEHFGGFDAGVVNLQFAKGAIGNVESYMDARYGYDVRTEIVGTRGTLQVGDTRSKPLTVLAAETRKEEVITHWLERFAEAYRLEMADFVRNILSNQPVAVDGTDGWHSLAIADAATRSQRERRPIAVPAAPVAV